MQAFIIPENTRKLETMWAIVSEDENGNHGIVGKSVAGASYPLVTMNPNILPAFKELALDTKRATGMIIKLVTLKVESMTEIQEGR